MPRKKKAETAKPYPPQPGERGLLLRWWREQRYPAEERETVRDEDAPIQRERTAGRAAAR